MAKTDLISTRRVALEAATVCQLKCPSCPTASGEAGKSLGLGYLSFENFQRFVDENPQVGEIELSNWGEILLNRELPAMMEYAYRRNVGLHAANGVNLNHAPEEVLRDMARWRFRTLNCSIDGATPETYARYRVGGDFHRVLEHIRTLNRYKVRYKTRFPELSWQFVVFGHNEHEIDRARELAAELNMDFRPKLSWGDLYDMPFSPVKDKERVRRATGIGAADREEYRHLHDRDYIEGCCVGMWNNVKVNFDGRVLGCCINYWGDYGNAFEAGLDAVVRGEKMQYARGMLMGRKPPRPDIPCTGCKVYRNSKAHSLWLNPGHVRSRNRARPRRFFRLQNKVLGEWAFGQAMKVAAPAAFHWNRLKRALRPRKPIPTSVQPLPLPLDLEGDIWRSRSQFSGRSASAHHLTVHTSCLAPGNKPHPPHSHIEEELLLLLEGEADLLLPDHPRPEERRQRLRAGEFVYYPSTFHHTLEPVGEKPALYTMFKWRGPEGGGKDILNFSRHDMQPPMLSENGRRRTQLLFQGPSRFLKKLHSHATLLPAGAGYKPHRDPYDAAVILLEGEVESLGKSIAAPSVLFYRAGEPHGMHNPGPQAARYLVVEFHPRKPGPVLRAIRGMGKIPKPPRVLGGIGRRLRNLK